VPREEYTPIIQAQIERGDVILSHYAAFFEAKQVAQEVYSPMYAKQLVNLSVRSHDFSPEERRRMTLLIVWPEQIESLSEYFGGKWIAVSEPFGDSYALPDLGRFPLVSHRLESHFATPQVCRRRLQVFRRAPEATADRGVSRRLEPTLGETP
jgi:hypothetical protein